MRATTILLVAALAWAPWQPAMAEGPAPPLVVYASKSGGATLDRGEGGGNPFATALIELLERPSLTFAELHADLVTLTEKKSHGFQSPDASAVIASPRLQLKPIPAAAKRVALVFVYADYRDVGSKSLPGAARDLGRVAAALRDAGFEVTTAIDPARDELQATLESFSTTAANADAAVIYITGHGFERDGQVYLMPSEHPFEKISEQPAELAVHVPSLTGYLTAKDANLLFFGGCRKYK